MILTSEPHICGDCWSRGEWVSTTGCRGLLTDRGAPRLTPGGQDTGGHIDRGTEGSHHAGGQRRQIDRRVVTLGVVWKEASRESMVGGRGGDAGGVNRQGTTNRNTGYILHVI
jgi:hypothetical protein